MGAGWLQRERMAEKKKPYNEQLDSSDLLPNTTQSRNRPSLQRQQKNFSREIHSADSKQLLCARLSPRCPAISEGTRLRSCLPVASVLTEREASKWICGRFRWQLLCSKKKQGSGQGVWRGSHYRAPIWKKGEVSRAGTQRKSIPDTGDGCTDLEVEANSVGEQQGSCVVG